MSAVAWWPSSGRRGRPTRPRRIVPDVVLLPPVCQGDLTSRRPQPGAACGPHRGRRVLPGAVGVAQGGASRTGPGVRVVGASSMGALRAAELDRFGMEGVGEVYAYYRDGWLTADADVALVHRDADDGLPPLTWPLVNVRATWSPRSVRRSRGGRATPCSQPPASCTSATDRAGACRALRGRVRRRRGRRSWQRWSRSVRRSEGARRGAGLERLGGWTEVPPPDRATARCTAGAAFQPSSGATSLPRRPARCGAISWSPTRRCIDPDFEA